MALGTCLCPEANDNRHLPFDLGPAAKPSFPDTSETLPPSPRRFRQQSPLLACHNPQMAEADHRAWRLPAKRLGCEGDANVAPTHNDRAVRRGGGGCALEGSSGEITESYHSTLRRPAKGLVARCPYYRRTIL